MVRGAPRSWTKAALFVGSPDLSSADQSAAVPARSRGVTIDTGTPEQATLTAPSTGLFVGEFGKEGAP